MTSVDSLNSRPGSRSGPAASPARLPWAGALGIGLAAGLTLGVLTNLAQGWLPGTWNQLANSGAVWCLAGFAVCAALPRRTPVATAAVTGLVTVVGLVVGYYGYAELGRGGMGLLYWPLVWTVMACVAGPLFGVAALWWRRSADPRRRITGLAAPAGVLGMEGIHYAWTLHYAAQAWACLALMVLTPLALARTTGERVRTLLVSVLFAVIAYTVLYAGILDRLSG